MIILALDAIPNQQFTAVLDGNRYVITIKEARGIMAATIVRNDVVVLSGARIVAGAPFFLYEYQEEGNFFIITENNDLPDHTKFGITQRLIYITGAEIEAYRG